MTTASHRVSSLLLAAPALAAVLAGCARNDRLTIGDLDQELTVRLPAVSEPAPLAPATGPSVTGLDRSGWQTTVIVVPVDEVSDIPTLRIPPVRFTDATARQRGEFPNAFSAVTPVSDQGDQVAEAAAEFGVGGLEMVTMPLQLVPFIGGLADRPPSERYERIPVAPISPVFFAPWFAGENPPPVAVPLGPGPDGLDSAAPEVAPVTPETTDTEPL
ncbi:MAG: hypothetical protein AAGI30_09925 [Planctomycetota bacterium]